MWAFGIITPLLAVASGATAAATPRSNTARAVQDLQGNAEKSIEQLKAGSCDIIACASAYAPSIAVCAAAIVEPTPLGEIACLAAIANSSQNPPASCSGCLD